MRLARGTWAQHLVTPPAPSLSFLTEKGAHPLHPTWPEGLNELENQVLSPIPIGSVFFLTITLSSSGRPGRRRSKHVHVTHWGRH